MSSDVLIRVEGVSKRFVRTLRKSMRYGVADIARDLVGLPTTSDGLRPSEFWAVDNVSFEVKRGECLGLIGPNGAGKSTILKMLNGIIQPDKGQIEMRGRSGALIEIGAGFHPMLTGRENIYVNGSILGLTKKQIDDKFDSIVEFSELEEFIDTPVKFYSSGMYVRLGFAVAAQMEPDVLIIDEVLAVGDVGFRAKCYNVIADFIESTAVVLVSHSIPMIARYATKIMVMNHGQMYLSDEKVEGIRYYYDIYSKSVSHHVVDSHRNHLLDFRIVDEKGDETTTVAWGGRIYIKLRAQVLDESEPICHLAFLSQEQTIVATVRSNHGDMSCNDGKLQVTIEIKPFLLSPGLYRISVLIFDRRRQKHLIWHDAVFPLQVVGEHGDYGPTAIKLPARFS